MKVNHMQILGNKSAQSTGILASDPECSKSDKDSASKRSAEAAYIRLMMHHTSV